MIGDLQYYFQTTRYNNIVNLVYSLILYRLAYIIFSLVISHKLIKYRYEIWNYIHMY